MSVGENQYLTITASYSDTSSAIVDSQKWSSLNENIATVVNGKVTALSEGTSTLVVVYLGITGQFPISVGVPEIAYEQHHGNLILVAGGGVQSSNTLKNSTQYLSDLIYGRFKARIFEDDDIFYMNPMSWHDLDGDGFPDNIVDDESPTIDDFGNAITVWAASQNTDGPLYIYLIDHGDNGSIDNYSWSFEIGNSPEITPTNPYDKNQDWIINDFELLDAIDAWAKSIIGEEIKDNCDIDFYLLNVIDFWKGDSYEYIKEKSEECFPWESIEY
jgi:hypothetical protein